MLIIWVRLWAPAAIDTISQHFKDTGYNPDSYDLIVTGDLALVGKRILIDLMKREVSIFLRIIKIVESRSLMVLNKIPMQGSGCACAAVVFNGYIYKEMAKVI